MRAFFLLLPACVLLLTACGDKDQASLPGERTPVLASLPTLPPTAEPRAAPVPPPGTPGHPSLAEGIAPRPAWSANIGHGTDKRTPLVARPVLSDGRVFTMDANGMVRAFDAGSGALAWEAKTRPKDEDKGPVTGGLAAEGGRVFVTTGVAAAVALDANTGQEVWRAVLSAPARAAPAVDRGRVLVITRDARVTALSAETGSIMWVHYGFAPPLALLTAAPPAPAGDVVLAAMPGGEVTALEAVTGAFVWARALDPRSGAVTGPTGRVADVAAPLVVAGKRAFALSAAGTLAAFNTETGKGAWTQPLSGASAPALAGTSLFALSEPGILAAIDAQSGAVLWTRPLDTRKDMEDMESDPLAWYGPVLAGGRLFLTASDGRVAVFGAAGGDPLPGWSVGTKLAQPPVAGYGRLYILTDAGQLLAFGAGAAPGDKAPAGS